MSERLTAGHPLVDPGDGRTECDTCGQWVFQAIHSCKGVPLTEMAWARWRSKLRQERGHCSACGEPAARTRYAVPPDVGPFVMWWHVDPRAMAPGKAHPTRAKFVPVRS